LFIGWLMLVPALLFAQKKAPAPLTAVGQGIEPTLITIVRDSYGVPHIFGRTHRDVAYGLAWATCEDDFANAQELLIAAKNLMGAEKGKDGAPTDFFSQWIRADEHVPADFERQLAPDFVAYQKAFLAGVNDYAARHPKEVRVKGLFPVTLREALRAYVVVFYGASHLPNALQAALKGHPDKFNYRKPDGRGSNGMVYRRSVTADGRTWLFINPHLPLQGPGSFYECHLHSDEGLNIHGATFPGASAPGLGVTPNLGWTHTSNWPDMIDIYRLVLNPANKNQYRFNGQWKDLEVRQARLRVKVGPVRITVRRELLWSIHGPAMRVKDTVFAFGISLPNAWRAGEEWYKRCTARNLTEFREAMRHNAITSFSTLYADKDDNGFFYFGTRLPKRDPRFDWQKCLPGDTSATLHTEWYGFDELPQILNPECGMLFNANNTPHRATCASEDIPKSRFPEQLGLWWNNENNRQHRFYELYDSLSKGRKLTEADLKRIKYDVCYPRNPEAPIHKAYRVVKSIDPTAYPDLKPALEILQSWDLCGDLANTHAALSVLVYYEVFNSYGYGFPEIESGFVPTVENIIAATRRVQERMYTAHGRLNPPFSEVQHHERGTRSLGVAGLPEVLAPMYAKEKRPGHLVANLGEDYIGIAAFGPNGLEQYETVVPYGACARPDSPHYTDQMDLFVQQKTKRIELDKQKILLNPTYRRYSPK
jgi:acyl-homoserine-lactone acylase